MAGPRNMNSFNQKMEYGYLPSVDSISSAGKFNEYYFQTKSNEAKQLVEINNSIAIDSEKEKFIALELTSCEDGKNKRNNMNFILVMDISGSMGERFEKSTKITNESTNSIQTKNKMGVAKDVMIKLLSILRKEDRFGIILFDDRSEILQPIRKVDSINLEKLTSDIKKVKKKKNLNNFNKF